MPRIPENGARIVFRCDRGADLSDLGLRLLLLGRRPVVLRLRDDALVQQALHPVEVEPRQLALRLDGGQLRLLLPRVELGQHLPLANRSAGLERDAIDDARQVGAHGHALNGGHRADGAQRRRPLLLLRDDGRDGFRRRLEGGALRDGRLNLPELHEAEGRDDDQHHREHQNHSFRHDFLFTLPTTRPAITSDVTTAPLEPDVSVRLHS